MSTSLGQQCFLSRVCVGSYSTLLFTVKDSVGVVIHMILFKDRHGSSNDVFRKKYQKRVFAIF